MSVLLVITAVEVEKSYMLRSTNCYIFSFSFLGERFVTLASSNMISFKFQIFPIVNLGCIVWIYVIIRLPIIYDEYRLVEI